MSIGLILALVAGALVGGAVALLITAMIPGHPHLTDALAALDDRTFSRPISAARDEDRPARYLLPMLRRLPGTVPDADLDLVGMSRDRFLLGRAAAAATYAAAGPVLATTFTILDVGIDLTIPGLFTVAGAVVGWTGFGRRISDRAENARTELRFALVSYLQQVSLLRHGGAGVATALTLPARLLSDSWAMRRLRDELDVAERSGEMPWEGIRRFGAQIDLSELTDLSSIAATAGQDGGAIVSTLLARADSLRDELLADEHGDANRATGQMSTPGAFQVFLIAAWVLFPAGMALLTSV